MAGKCFPNFAFLLFKRKVELEVAELELAEGSRGRAENVRIAGAWDTYGQGFS